MQRVPEAIIDRVFEAIVAARDASPSRVLPRRLGPLFRELARTPPTRDPEELSDLIWALWISHPDVEAANEMTAAIEAMAQGAGDLARPILDRLVQRFPDWAEAWNKRATLAYGERRDADSLADILRTVALEPRHFGAILGFGQICLRHGRPLEAKAAFEIARAIHPHLEGLDAIIAELGSTRAQRH